MKSMSEYFSTVCCIAQTELAVICAGILAGLVSELRRHWCQFQSNSDCSLLFLTHYLL